MHIFFNGIIESLKKNDVKFYLKIDDCRVYLAKDGTEVEDETYFETIEPQTLFVIASSNTQVKTGKKMQSKLNYP